MNALIEACKDACEELARKPVEGSAKKRLRKDDVLRRKIEAIEPLLNACGEVFAPPVTRSPLERPLKAVTWNIERGKRYDAIERALTTHPDLKDADLYFLTEVDWGMARSGNRNVAADLAKSLGAHAYFAPSYFNFTNGHGNERHLSGQNTLGLHGKAVLSRFPLTELRASPMPNAVDKLTSKEARIGQKRSLTGVLEARGRKVSLACVHLDAFSSPKMRAVQIREAVKPLLGGLGPGPSLVAGDWNTNTINSSSGRTILLSVLRQLVFTGPRRMISQHHPYPEKKYDRRVFQTLMDLGFEVESFNETGVGTYDLVNDDMDLGQMALDQFPRWILEWINRLVAQSGGLVSLKLDWFAGRDLKVSDKKVIRLKAGVDHAPDQRPSDHHPVLLTFEI